ncbi:hypothetical protein R3P38DRAFT_3565128 [Favolaschia claudopus]|uniref:Uncharacterized protein n=1 Tax=Favolaschia claudopus TaxID=2862362 RepID=A0AAW0DW02_9AGAR
MVRQLSHQLHPVANGRPLTSLESRRSPSSKWPDDWSMIMAGFTSQWPPRALATSLLSMGLHLAVSSRPVARREQRTSYERVTLPDRTCWQASSTNSAHPHDAHGTQAAVTCALFDEILRRLFASISGTGSHSDDRHRLPLDLFSFSALQSPITGVFHLARHTPMCTSAVMPFPTKRLVRCTPFAARVSDSLYASSGVRAHSRTTSEARATRIFSKPRLIVIHWLYQA